MLGILFIVFVRIGRDIYAQTMVQCAAYFLDSIALIYRCVIRNCLRSRATSRLDIFHNKHSAEMESSGDF